MSNHATAIRIRVIQANGHQIGAVMPTTADARAWLGARYGQVLHSPDPVYAADGTTAVGFEYEGDTILTSLIEYVPVESPISIYEY